MRILVAEDDLTSRVALTGVLKKEGYDVVVAMDGVEALRLLQQPEPPLLVILDWVMPELDGPEVVRCIRACELERQPYIIILTSKVEKIDVVSAFESGADDYLAKPFDPGELCARVGVGRRLIDVQELLASKVRELSLALEQIKTLRGIVPICSCCKKIRDDQGYWNQLETYVRDHTEAEFSHGLCPECAEKLYPDIILKNK